MRNSKGQFVKGHSVSKETREKMSNTHKRSGVHPTFSGLKHSESSKEKMRLAQSSNKWAFKKGCISWIKGKHHTEEMKKRISESLTGKKQSKESIEKRVSKIRGIKRTEEWKRKRSEDTRGEKSPNWKGGRTLLSSLIKHCFEYKNWRTKVFTRDKYSCQKCKVIGGELHPHHIKSFSSILTKNNIKTLEQAIKCKELWNTNNGLTLCIGCHKQTDSYAKNYEYQIMPPVS